MNEAFSAFLIFSGLGMIAAGLDLSHGIDGPIGQAASVLAPAGAIMSAAGAISFMLPDFF